MHAGGLPGAVRLILGAWIAAATLTAAAGPRDDGVAAVSVHRQVRDRQVVYTYTVANRGERPITALSIGFDFYRGLPELSGAVPTQLQSPAGWGGRAITVEGSDSYELRWENPQAPLLPGRTLGGFGVTLPMDDPRFATAHWTVLVDGPPLHASAPLQPGRRK